MQLSRIIQATFANCSSNFHIEGPVYQMCYFVNYTAYDSHINELISHFMRELINLDEKLNEYAESESLEEWGSGLTKITAFT
jgi:hypothetical protein